MTELCGRCQEEVPQGSHSPWFCCVAYETAWRGERLGEQAPTAVSAQVTGRALSLDGYGAARWSRLSWWPHPADRRREVDGRNALEDDR